MAQTHELYLENDDITLTLHSGFYQVGKYWNPRTAKQNPKATSELSEDAYLPVTERIPLVIRGGDMYDIRNYARKLQQLLSDARHRQLSGNGPKVWLRYGPEGHAVEGGEYKAEVLGGDFEYDINVMHYVEDSTNQYAEGMLEVVRAGVWRSVDVVNQSMDSYTTSGSTTVLIQNGNSNNYVEFTPATTIPTPAKITIIHQSSEDDWDAECDIYIGHNVYNDPENFDHDLHFSLLDGDVGSGTAYNSWGSDTDFDTMLYAYPLSTAFLADAKGDDFRVICTMNLTAGAYLRAGIYGINGSDYYPLIIGEPVLSPVSEHHAYDLGSFPIPPGGSNAGGYQSVALCMSVYHESAGSASIAATQVWPTTSFQHLVKLDTHDLTSEHIIVDDGIDDTAYSSNGSARIPSIVPKLNHIWLMGGERVQRLYFSATGQTTSSILGDDLRILVSYERRILTL